MKSTHNRFAGILWGMLSGASFGLIPLFTLPLLAEGVTTDSVLFYRFATSAIIIGLILLLRGESFRINKHQAIRLTLLGLLYMSSSFFLLWGYEFMAAGIATAVHFLYPVCVVLLMTLFFGERASVKNFGAVILAVIGVAVLSSAESGLSHSTSTQGIIIVIISSLAYAIYIIGVKKMNIGTLSDFKLSFYVISTTALMFLIKATLMGDGITVVQNATQTTNIILLALIPTVLSNFALIKAIKSV
ncbi:MAG: DMT family transporter, partial [Mucinivorans sp.]